MSIRQVVLAVCGSTFPQVKATCGDFPDWFRAKLPELDIELLIWNAHALDPEPDLTDVIGCIVTGSPAMVTDRAEWSEHLGQWLLARLQDKTPVLGVCYGHQLLADVLGGQVDFQPDGREIGSLLIRQTEPPGDDPLFKELPATFYAHLTHGQSVTGLPSDAICLASSQRVPQQAFRWGESCWGVQFHPEFTETIMAHYLAAYREQIPAEMRLQLQSNLHQCTEASSLLPRFVDFCIKKAE